MMLGVSEKRWAECGRIVGLLAVGYCVAFAIGRALRPEAAVSLMQGGTGPTTIAAHGLRVSQGIGGRCVDIFAGLGRSPIIQEPLTLRMFGDGRCELEFNAATRYP